MAAHKTKKAHRPGKADVWSAHPDDAIRLAALRWFALQIESLAIEIYASDKAHYARLEKVLRRALREMKDTKRFINVHAESDCPDGYVLCKDGLCAPMCDGVIGATES